MAESHVVVSYRRAGGGRTKSRMELPSESKSHLKGIGASPTKPWGDGEGGDLVAPGEADGYSSRRSSLAPGLTIRSKRGYSSMATKTKQLTLGFIWNIRLKLWAEGSKLRAEGDKLWAEAILEVYGNITLDWQWVKSKQASRCVLGTGEVFEP